MSQDQYQFHWRRYFKLNERIAKMQKEYDGYVQEVKQVDLEWPDSLQMEDLLMGQANTIDHQISILKHALMESCKLLGFERKTIILCN